MKTLKLKEEFRAVPFFAGDFCELLPDFVRAVFESGIEFVSIMMVLDGK